VSITPVAANHGRPRFADWGAPYICVRAILTAMDWTSAWPRTYWSIGTTGAGTPTPVRPPRYADLERADLERANRDDQRVDLDELEALRTPAGEALLASALAGLDAGADLLPLTTRLRTTGAGPALVAAALTQAQLRVRARAKFGSTADRMFWTSAGFEQSTRASVAAHRAERFTSLAPGRVADLCCGVGGDLLALAAAGLEVVGVDRDPVTAAVARTNLELLGLAAHASVRVEDVTTTDLNGFDSAFLDPARRSSSGRRTFDPASYSPSFAFAVELAERVSATAVKVAPGIPHSLVPAGTEAEWVSDAGDVKEAVLWSGGLAPDQVGRRATLLPSGATVTDDVSLGPPRTGAAGRYLHEPDGAVVRAGLVAEAAARVDGWLLDPTIAYVSTDSEVRSPFTKRYAVELVVPFQLKRLRALLRERGVGDVVVKKRGTAVEPEELRRRLKLDGAGPMRTLVLTRVDGQPIVLLCDPAP